MRTGAKQGQAGGGGGGGRRRGGGRDRRAAKAVKGKGAGCDKARAAVDWCEGGDVHVTSAEAMMAVPGAVRKGEVQMAGSAAKRWRMWR